MRPLPSMTETAATRRVKGRYQIKRLLASGGQCRVYLALDEAHAGRRVVLKNLKIRSSASADAQIEVSLFRQEGLILSRVDHPSLPAFVDAFEDEGGHYVVEEFVGDATLESRLRRTARGLDAKEVAWVGHRLLDLLVALHGQHPAILLRDIKPSNIMCLIDGHGVVRRDAEVWFIDLTIAQEYVPNRADEVKMGTPGYAPPEQYRGRTQPSSDLYALGVTMFAALTGHEPAKTPFRLPPLSTLRDDLSQGWEDFFARACALDPASRFATAKEMRAALERLMAPAACAGPIDMGRRAARRGRRLMPSGSYGLLITVAALVVLIAVAVLAVCL